jgi:hypothetical protein
MVHFITILTVLLCCVTARANDGWAVGVGGRWRLMESEHGTVRLVREAIRMDVYPEYYDVNVEFVFKNEGVPVTVPMGFPESGGGDIGPAEDFRNHSGFVGFATWVDGGRVKAQRVVTRAKDEWYEALWLKRVRFGRGQTRRIRVRYRAPHGAAVGEGLSTSYDFTGGNWRDKVEQSTLTVVTHLSGLYQLSATFKGKPLPLRRRGNRFFFQWSNWQAQGDFTFRTASLLRGWLTFGEHASFVDPDRVIVDFPAPNYYARVEKDGVWWTPPAVLRDGTAFISVNALSYWLRDKANKGQQSYLFVHSNPDLHHKTMTLRMANDGVYPNEVRHSLRFQLGRRQMVLDGKNILPLPAAPFNVGRFDSELNFYVPLRPILELLGGWARVDASKHRLNFDAPTHEFWKPAR